MKIVSQNKTILVAKHTPDLLNVSKVFFWVYRHKTYASNAVVMTSWNSLHCNGIHCPHLLWFNNVLYFLAQRLRWTWLSSGMLRPVVWQKYADVSQVLAASIISVIALLLALLRSRRASSSTSWQTTPFRLKTRWTRGASVCRVDTRNSQNKYVSLSCVSWTTFCMFLFYFSSFKVLTGLTRLTCMLCLWLNCLMNG